MTAITRAQLTYNQPVLAVALFRVHYRSSSRNIYNYRNTKIDTPIISDSSSIIWQTAGVGRPSRGAAGGLARVVAGDGGRAGRGAAAPGARAPRPAP